MAVIGQNYATYPDPTLAPAPRFDPAPGYDPNNPSAGKPNDVPAGAFGNAGAVLEQPKIGDVLGNKEQTDTKTANGVEQFGTTTANAKVAQAVASVNTFQNYLQASISPSGMVSYGV